MTRHAARCSWSWPRFSDDQVVQFTVEEALVTRMDADEERQRRETADREAVAQAEQRVSTTLAKLQGRMH